MMPRRATLWSSLLLVVGLTLVASPARAAGEVSVTLDAGTVVVDASAAPTNLHVGWDPQAGGWVTFQASRAWGAVPPACELLNDPVLGTYLYCPGDQVDSLGVAFSPGPDLLRVSGVCIPRVVADMGAGNDDFENMPDCPQPSTSQVQGGAGDDLVNTGPWDDAVDGGPGNDDISTRAGNDTVSGGDGNDKIQGGVGNDNLAGGGGDDTVHPAAGNDVGDGGDGADTFTSEQWDVDTGADDLRGGPGVDTIDLLDHPGGATIRLDDVANDGAAGEGDNYHSDFERIIGTNGSDMIVGSAGPDWVRGWGGNDTIQGMGGNDELDGESGNDVIDGGEGSDILYGGYDNDDVTGGPGADTLYGDYTQCTVHSCPAGADVLRSRDGAVDAVNCGAGADQAVTDNGDVLARDGFQVCEAVDASGSAGGPGGAGGSGAGTTAMAVASASRAKGVRVSLTCPSTCKARLQVGVSKKLMKKYRLKSAVIGTLTASITGTRTVRIKIHKWAVARLRGKGVVKASVKVSAGGRTIARSIRLKA